MTSLRRTFFSTMALVITLPVAASVPISSKMGSATSLTDIPEAKTKRDLPLVEMSATAPTPFDDLDEPKGVSEELQALIDGSTLVAANTKKVRKPKTTTRSAKSPRTSSAARSSRTRSSKPVDRNLQRARQLAADGKYHEASRLLFQLSRTPQFQKDSTQIRYILGLMLFEMKLYQTAAFVFYDVVKAESRGGGRGRYLRNSLEKLSLAADALDSDVLLKYAVKKINPNDFPAVHRDMLYFRTGEIKLGDKEFQEAARMFARVKPGSVFYPKAKYKQALAHTEAGELEKAQAAFEDLASTSRAVTDVNRVSGLLGRARVLYQRQNWDAAIDAYREIPRDTEQWHEALFESTWALLRSARFRSALSNFHSLHSDYYEDVYQPESLLLRSMVYLFICRFDEMEKVLGLFEKIYKPVLREVKDALRDNVEPLTYYRELSKVAANFKQVRSDKRSRIGHRVPFLVARHILKEGDVRRSFSYIARLEEEKRRISSMPGSWSQSPIGRYAKQVVDRRIEATQQFAGKLIKRHLGIIGRELVDLTEQDGFLRLEVIRGKKEGVKKEIAGKGLAKNKIDEDSSRQFYIQNGFEYWPFKGEYWLDEIGNYHYVGVQACE